MQRGLAAVQAQDVAAAALWFEQALKESPGDPQAMAWLGQCLCNVGQEERGVAHLREAAQAYVKLATAQHGIAPAMEIIEQLQEWGDVEGAVAALHLAAEYAPGEFRVFQMLAAGCAQLNRKSDALTAGRRALALAPDNVMMAVFLGSLEADAGLMSDAKVRLENVLAARPPAREAFRAHKELARICDKLGLPDEVFVHLHAAARESKGVPEYAQQKIDFLPNMIRSNQASFDHAVMSRWVGERFDDARPAPVFLMGFFRSGTTLTQEVLAAHPDVFVADEADFIWAVQREVHRADPSTATTAAKLAKLDREGIQRLRNFYWNRVEGRFGNEMGQRCFVDKFTLNTVDAGLISCIFPDAKILFVKRDPRDVCLSCFMQLMVPSPATVQLLEWERTARFFAQTMAWWEFVRPQLGIPVLEFRYEDAVAGFEQTFRRVFDFIGLTWDPAVMEFHKSAAQRTISTPSRSQVVQPLYGTSVQRWQRFAKEFDAVAPILAPYIAEYDLGASK